MLRSTLSLLVCVSGISVCSAQPRLPQAIHFPVLAGLECILRQEYERADRIFRSVADSFPSHPAGPIFRAAVLQARSFDYGTLVEKEQFDSLIAVGRERTERLLEDRDSRLWGQFFDATADGYVAVDRVERGDWFAGVTKAMSSADTFEELLRSDSSFTDACPGVGTYQYWKSRKTAFLQWIPFVSDGRSEGIRLLIRGAESGIYNKFASMSALVSVLIDAGSYDDAARWATAALDSFPMNRVFLWGRATALHRALKYDSAVPAYESLLNRILESGSPVPYDEIVCRLNLVKCRREIGQTSGVLAHMDAILAHESSIFPEDLKERAQAKFEETRGLRRRLARP